MKDFVIVTDNAADLYFGYYDEHPTVQLPMPFTIEDKSYEFEEECPSMLEYYDILKSGKLVNTAQVNQETARVMLKKVLEENPDKDLLFLSFSSGMSGSFNGVSAVSEELKKEYPDQRIVVIDTLSGAGSEGLLVYYAKKLQDEGASMDQVIEWVEQNKKNSHNIFIVDDLKNLRHSGRISSIAALFGIVFQIKPVLELSNEGKIALLGKAMGRKKAIDEIVRYFNEYYVKDVNDFILVGHTGNEVDAKLLADKIQAVEPNVPVKYGYINRLVSGCAGYNALVVYFMGRPRRKRIADQLQDV